MKILREGCFLPSVIEAFCNGGSEEERRKKGEVEQQQVALQSFQYSYSTSS